MTVWVRSCMRVRHREATTQHYCAVAPARAGMSLMTRTWPLRQKPISRVRRGKVNLGPRAAGSTQGAMRTCSCTGGVRPGALPRGRAGRCALAPEFPLRTSNCL